MKTKTKILSLILANLLLFPNLVVADGEISTEENSQNYFIVTAYYSPLPGQEYYVMGSYENEIVMEGKGVSGASGKEVFEGMFAGPKSYPFGTQIYIEGIGTGVIADRGGAIVEAGKRDNKYDRIDVWMGYGDEGLARALAWGKRTVSGKILGQVDLSSNQNYKLDYKINNVKPPKTLYNSFFGPNSSYDDLVFLQKELSSRGLYNGEIDGKFNTEIRDFIVGIQLYGGIISSINDSDAGYWGNKTIAYFKKIESGLISGTYSLEEIQKNLEYNKSLIIENDETDKLPQLTENNQINDNISSEDDINTEPNISLYDHNSPIFFQTYVHPDSEKKDVEILQNFLKEMEMYDEDIDGEYNKVYDILLNYQLENGIIQSEKDKGAGHFGPLTRKSLKIVYDKSVQKENFRQEAYDYAEEIIELISELQYGDTSSEVRELQKILKKLGYFERKDTGNFFDETAKSIVKFQIDNNIITSENDENAGILSEKTLEMLKYQLIIDYLHNKIQEKNSKNEGQVV